MSPSRGASREALRATIVDLVVAGKGPGEISRILPVSRTSVWRELKDPETIALLNRRRQEIWGVLPDLMRAITLDALRVIRKRIRANDTAVAREWIRTVARAVVPALHEAGTEDVEALRASLLAQFEVLDLERVVEEAEDQRGGVDLDG